MLAMKYVALAMIVAGIAVSYVMWDEIPAWRLGGSNSLPLEGVATSPAPNMCPEGGETIELRGDSLVAGGRMGSVRGMDSLPYGVVLERELGRDVEVLLRGRGGSTAAQGEEAWRDEDRHGDIVLLAYGTNDAAPRGWLRSKVPVPIEEFEAALGSQVRQALARGSRVGLMAPPPGGSVAINRRLQVYREAVARVAQETGVPAFDPADALAECRETGPLLSYDALHLNPRGHHCIGIWLAKELCPENLS